MNFSVPSIMSTNGDDDVSSMQTHFDKMIDYSWTNALSLTGNCFNLN